ncbi:MAG: FHA domain-containing protein [Bacillota bacterium]|nr:FHA domain-containing protein [Bacillota bacterium]
MNEPISYILPQNHIVEEEEESFEILDFENPDPNMFIQNNDFEKDLGIYDEVGIGDFAFLREEKEEVVEEEEDNTLIYNPSSNYATETFATISRVSTGEMMIVDSDEFILGKSKKIVGFTIVGNQTISRKHACISKKEDDYYISDLESVNHTYVNGRKVKLNKEVQLFDGDIIQLANEDFEFHIIKNEH